MGVEEAHRLVEHLATGEQNRLRQFLRRRVRNADDIPDVIQEVFLRLLRVPRHETIRVPERYIFTIARHVAAQHALRNARSEPSVRIEDVLPELGSGDAVDPYLEATAAQCLQDVNAAMAEMAPKVLATFLLSRRDDLTVEEIAARLGISKPMAKKYLVKSLVQIRSRLKASE